MPNAFFLHQLSCIFSFAPLSCCMVYCSHWFFTCEITASFCEQIPLLHGIKYFDLCYGIWLADTFTWFLAQCLWYWSQDHVGLKYHLGTFTNIWGGSLLSSYVQFLTESISQVSWIQAFLGRKKICINFLKLQLNSGFIFLLLMVLGPCPGVSEAYSWLYIQGSFFVGLKIIWGAGEQAWVGRMQTLPAVLPLQPHQALKCLHFHNRIAANSITSVLGNSKLLP